MKNHLERIRAKQVFICDMDGVPYHGNRFLPRVSDFVAGLINALYNAGLTMKEVNPNLVGPVEKGVTPATGPLISPIELSTGSKAYFGGKPNPLMMRHALKRLKTKREDTIIIAGIEAEIETVLVLSGVTDRENMKRFSYKPHFILEGAKDIP